MTLLLLFNRHARISPPQEQPAQILGRRFYVVRQPEPGHVEFEPEEIKVIASIKVKTNTVRVQAPLNRREILKAKGCIRIEASRIWKLRELIILALIADALDDEDDDL